MPWRVCRSVVADSDPDPHQSGQADPDPHQFDANPQIVLQRLNPELR